MITPEQYMKIINKIKGKVESIILTGGEPTLWKSLIWATYVAKEFDMKVSVISNGIGRTVADYGASNKVFITNYGAINRTDIHRLKKDLGRRFRIANNCQLDWPMPTVEDSLPAICNCAHLFFAGDRVWPCQASVYVNPGVSVDDDFFGAFWGFNPYMQEICKSCLSNFNVRKHVEPSPTIEVGLWNSRYMWLFSPNSKCSGFRMFLRKFIKRE